MPGSLQVQRERPKIEHLNDFEISNTMQKFGILKAAYFAKEKKMQY